MKAYIVRHGQTEENLMNIMQGHMPGTLTALGKEQVRETAERLAEMQEDFKCIVASDLKRAMDSAEIIAERLKLPVVAKTILRERDWGKYTGMTVAEASEKYRINGRWSFPEGTAEMDEGIYGRAGKALKELKEEFGDGSIVVVTHGQFARNMLAWHNGCGYHDVPPFGNAEIRVIES